MPHRLVLVRHAKSWWSGASLADRDRPLAPRGIGALPAMRDHLTALGTTVDLVLCSPARRTRDTLEGIHPALRADVRVIVEEDLYGIDARGLLARLQTIDDAVAGVLVVGHNPTLQMLGELLAGTGDPADRAQLRTKFPTGAIATLTLDDEWSTLDRGSAHLDDLFMPRPPRS